MTTDNKNYIDNFYQSLTDHFSSVQLIALGTEEDVLSLKHRYTDIISAEDIGYDFKSDRLILTSLDAFYEIRSYLTKFEEITFWFDPEFSIQDKELGFLTSISATSLVEHASGGVCASTRQGQLDWDSIASTEVPLVHSQFELAASSLESEPLIEKKGLPRILIDGSANISNYPMVNAFIEIEQTRVPHEKWCLFDGELKSWMKPDFQVSSIVSTQLPLYLNSVDGIVVVGDVANLPGIVDYLSLGKMPIVISKDVEEAISEKVSLTQVKQEFPNFGTAELLKELISDVSRLAQYNACAQDALLPNTYFEFSQIENIKASKTALKSYLAASQTTFAQEEYMQAKYGNRAGSSLHKKLRQDAQIIAEVPSTVVREGRFTGWTIDTAAMDVTKPLVLSKDCAVPASIRRYNRADVNEHFSVTGIDNVGFASVFVIPDTQVSEDSLFYAVENTTTQCVKIHTMLEELDVHYAPAEFAKTGMTITTSESIQGCVETLTFSKAALFNLEGIEGDAFACDFRLQVESGYVASDAVDVYVVSDSQLVKVEAATDDDFSFSLASCDGVDQISQLIVMGHKMVEQDLKCVLSSSDPSVSYSSVKFVAESNENASIESEEVIAVTEMDDTVAISSMDDTVAMDETVAIVAIDESSALDETIAIDSRDDTLEIAKVIALNLGHDTSLDQNMSDEESADNSSEVLAEQKFIDVESIEEGSVDGSEDVQDSDVKRAA